MLYTLLGTGAELYDEAARLKVSIVVWWESVERREIHGLNKGCGKVLEDNHEVRLDVPARYKVDSRNTLSGSTSNLYCITYLSRPKSMSSLPPACLVLQEHENGGGLGWLVVR